MVVDKEYTSGNRIYMKTAEGMLWAKKRVGGVYKWVDAREPMLKITVSMKFEELSPTVAYFRKAGIMLGGEYFTIDFTKECGYELYQFENDELDELLAERKVKIYRTADAVIAAVEGFGWR